MRSLLCKLLPVLITCLVSDCFSQSKKMWIEGGDKAFKERDYSTAILYYLKVIDDTSVMKSVVLPYEVQLVNQKFKPDSTKKHKRDTLKIAKIDTSAKNRNKGALESLKKSHPKEYVYFKLGEAYRFNAEPSKAVEYHRMCAESGKYPDSRYFLGLSLMNERKYQNAMDEFEKYINSGTKNDSLAALAQKMEGGCYLGLDSMNVKREIKIRMPDTNSINKGNSSFGACYDPSSQKIIFTSARKGNVIKDPKKEVGDYLCDLFSSEKTDTAWISAVNFGAPLNTNEHEAASSIGPDNTIYFTKWNDMKPDDVCIYQAKMQNERVYQPQKMSPAVNVSGFKAMHPSISSDGKRFFFSSNRPGGKGGLDIWMCTVDESGMMSEPKNVGAPVNTAGDEETPFYHVLSGQLYFSSNGLVGLGGLDIFKAEFNADENLFGIPVNIGAPINSSNDDAYFIMEKTQQRGLFSSDRAECPGGNCYKIYEFVSEPIRFDVSGIVFDSKTNEPMPMALVTIRNVHNDDDIQMIPTNEKGEYFAELKAGAEYFMKAQKNKFFGDAASVLTKDKSATTHFENQDFFLTAIPEGEIEIQGIEYDFNSAALRPVSMASLDKIAELLILNDNLTVDIEANTDSRGNDAYNLKLSQARAQSCVDYLISKGVTANRLSSKGNGETKPLITDEEIKKMVAKSPEFEAAHQKNRRTALKIVGESKINIINSGK